MKHILATILTAVSLTASAQTIVNEFHPGITTEGICYFLPQTRLHLTIQAECTKKYPGEFAPYASYYLRVEDAIQQEEEVWTLTGITATAYGVADPTKAYTIRLKAKTLAPLVTLTQDGCLLAINAEVPQPASLSQPSTESLPSTYINAADYKTPDILAATNPRKAAELTAAEIYDIRENRSMLNKGQADFMPKDGEQLRQMLDGLSAQENALLQLFKGYTSTSRHTYTLDITPSQFNGKSVVAFRFSPRYGLCEADDLSGEPYTLTLTDLHTLPAEETPLKPIKKEVQDLRYYVCSNANVKIADPDGKEYFQQVMPFTQIGRVEHLGSELLNKRLTTRVMLSPTTGSITRIQE